MKTKEINQPPFTQVPNAILLNDNISFRAKGLLALILSRNTDTWNIYVNELVARSKREGKSAVQKALKELVTAKYLFLRKERDPRSNKFKGTRYVVNTAECRICRVPKFPTGENTTDEKVDCIVKGKKAILIIQK